MGPALHDVREVMIDGQSGLKWIEPLKCRRPHYSPSRRILSFDNGAEVHVGLLPTLEDQMCQFGAEGFCGSPDRVDALVWAIWALLQQGNGPWVRVLGTALILPDP